MQEQQERAGAATEPPYPPSDEIWSSVRYDKVPIDPSRPEFADLAPADFPAFDTDAPPDRVDNRLDSLETDDNEQLRGGREVAAVAAPDGSEPGNQA